MALFLFLVAGLILLLAGGRRIASLVLTLAVVGYAVLGLSPLSRLLLLPLEEHFPAANISDLPRAPAGIIVLGGAVNTRVSRTRGRPVLNDAAERKLVGAALARRFPTARLLVSNGRVTRIDKQDPYGYVEYRVFESLGIARDRIIFEKASSDTYDNAVNGKATAKPEQGDLWLLVTSARHMPRAVGVFRRVGFDVVPWPVDYWTAGRTDVWRPFRRPADGLKFADAAFKEWAGLAYYWLSGRTGSFLPSSGQPAIMRAEGRVADQGRR